MVSESGRIRIAEIGPGTEPYIPQGHFDELHYWEPATLERCYAIQKVLGAFAKSGHSSAKIYGEKNQEMGLPADVGDYSSIRRIVLADGREVHFHPDYFQEAPESGDEFAGGFHTVMLHNVTNLQQDWSGLKKMAQPEMESLIRRAARLVRPGGVLRVLNAFYTSTPVLGDISLGNIIRLFKQSGLTHVRTSFSQEDFAYHYPRHPSYADPGWAGILNTNRNLFSQGNEMPLPFILYFEKSSKRPK